MIATICNDCVAKACRRDAAEVFKPVPTRAVARAVTATRSRSARKQIMARKHGHGNAIAMIGRRKQRDASIGQQLVTLGLQWRNAGAMPATLSSPGQRTRRHTATGAAQCPLWKRGPKSSRSWRPPRPRSVRGSAWAPRRRPGFRAAPASVAGPTQPGCVSGASDGRIGEQMPQGSWL